MRFPKYKDLLNIVLGILFIFIIASIVYFIPIITRLGIERKMEKIMEGEVGYGGVIYGKYFYYTLAPKIREYFIIPIPITVNFICVKGTLLPFSLPEETTCLYDYPFFIKALDSSRILKGSGKGLLKIKPILVFNNRKTFG